MPLLKKIETHSKIDQRIRAVRGAPPAWWQLGERYGDWSRARRIEKFKATLNGVSNALLNSPELTEARATHSAFVTFEWEEGRLEALHAFQKDWWQCGAGHVVAHAVGEPADLYHHDLEHRGSWGNVARRAAALCALTLVLGCAFAVLFANTKLDDILLTNATSSLCNGLSIAIDSAVEGATDFVTQGAEGGEAASGDVWVAAAAEAAVQAGSGSGDAGGAEGEAEAVASEFCVQVSDLAGRFLPVLVAPMVNNVLYVVVDVLARKERPASFTELTYTKATHIFLFQLLNIGGITLLIAANSRVQQNRAEAQEASAALEATGDGDEGSGAAPSPPPEMWWAQLTTGGDYSAAGRYDFALDYRW